MKRFIKRIKRMNVLLRGMSLQSLREGFSYKRVCLYIACIVIYTESHQIIRMYEMNILC